LTQLDVANHLEYTTAQFISNWERGISMPPMDTLPRLSNLLKIAPRDLIEVINDYQEQILKMQKKQLLDLFRQHARA
jgi:transcriptional regulator with XRE-family HTH domain